MWYAGIILAFLVLALVGGAMALFAWLVDSIIDRTDPYRHVDWDHFAQYRKEE